MEETEILKARILSMHQILNNVLHENIELRAQIILMGKTQNLKETESKVESL